MVHRSQVLIITAKGKEEIRTQAHELAPRLRRTLILVDGRSTVDETLVRLAVLGDDIEHQLETLLLGGFLAPRDAPLAAWAMPNGTEFNLDKAKGFARFVILGSLGPVGARRVERIEATKSPGELRAELDELRAVLPKLLPRGQATQVWEQLEPLMVSLS
jgi:hypothetical protein